MRQEVRVYQYTIGRNQSCIVLKEEGGGDLWSGEMELAGNSEGGKADVHFADNICALFFLLGFEFSLGLVFLQSRVVLPDHSLDLCGVSFLKDFLWRGKEEKSSYGAELACLLCNSHVGCRPLNTKLELCKLNVVVVFSPFLCGSRFLDTKSQNL